MPRDVVDYALQRRADLAALFTGRASAYDACDAHPYLRLAARHYGEPSASPCPVCGHNSMRDVHYVYGDALGRSTGQAKSRAELPQMAAAYAEFTVYVVEVCADCGWNHLIRSFGLGEAGDRQPKAADG